jgi:hypothetical protein
MYLVSNRCDVYKPDIVISHWKMRICSDEIMMKKSHVSRIEYLRRVERNRLLWVWGLRV